MAPPASPAAPRYHVVHTTRYAFSQVVAAGTELTLRLAPRGAASHQLIVRPLAASTAEGTDELGNRWLRATLSGGFSALLVTAKSLVAPREETPGTDGATLDRLRTWSARVPEHPAFHEIANRSLGRARLTGEDLANLSAAIRRDFVFDQTAVDPEGALELFLATRRGVCQDFAHLAVGCLRAARLPACYALGYPAVPAETGACHAWALAWLPDEGWIALDPTSGRAGPLGHLVLGLGRDHGDVAPVSGTMAYAGDCRLAVRISVRQESTGESGSAG